MTDSKRILIIAHRGASAYEHENTLASIEKAIELGADAVEFDLRRTGDGVVVLWHDERIRLLTGKTPPISKISFDQLEAFSRENGFQPATFEEVLQSFGSRIAFDIEIKAAGFENEVLDLLRKYPPIFPPMISSFQPGIIRKIKNLERGVKTGLVIGNSAVFRLGFMPLTILRRQIIASRAESVHLNLNIASKTVINELTDFDFEIYIWTVNYDADMRRFAALGVDGIISDRPDLLKSVLSSEKRMSVGS